VLVWGRVPISLPGSGLKPVKDSILLRSSVSPFSWAAVAEVKLITRDLGRALAGIQGTVLLAAAEVPSVFMVVERSATTERSAEDAVVDALKEAALSLSPMGAYLLPLDSGQAKALLQPALEASGVDERDWSTALESGSYDLVSIRQERGFARSLGLFKRGEAASQARIPPPGHTFTRPPFVTLVYKAVGARMGTPHPDQYAAFLSSLVATSGEPIGTRVLDAGAGSQAQTVLVKSQGSPPVELSQAQLRAVVRIYDHA
jgi:hypothetical protein